MERKKLIPFVYGYHGMGYCHIHTYKQKRRQFFFLLLINIFCHIWENKKSRKDKKKIHSVADANELGTTKKEKLKLLRESFPTNKNFKKLFIEATSVCE